MEHKIDDGIYRYPKGKNVVVVGFNEGQGVSLDKKTGEITVSNETESMCDFITRNEENKNIICNFTDVYDSYYCYILDPIYNIIIINDYVILSIISIKILFILYLLFNLINNKGF